MHAAFRSVRRMLLMHPGPTLLNVGGLALGLAAAFVLALYVRSELTHDRRFDDGDRIYRIATDFYEMGGFAKSQQQLLDILPGETPAIEYAARFNRSYRPVPVYIDRERLEVENVLFADSSFFGLFSYRTLAGDPGAILNAPNEAVVTPALAERFFGETPAVGQTILVGLERSPYRIGAVVEPPPGKTHLAADLWLSDSFTDPTTHWSDASLFNYVRLRPGADRADLERGLEAVLRRHAFPASGFDGTFEQWQNTSTTVRLWAQPLHDIYLHSDLNLEMQPGGSPGLVAILGLVGLLILLIAGMNYVNLSTAYATLRAKEVGVKKTMGAARSVLVRQFLSETVLLSLIAALAAAGLAEGLLGLFTAVTGQPVGGSILTDGAAWLGLMGFAVVVGVLAGLYPAVYLARFNPSRVLKGHGVGRGNHRLRGALVVTQFAIATALAVTSLVVYRQLAYMQSADKGFEAEGVLVVENAQLLGTNSEAFRTSLEQLPQVRQTGYAGQIPTTSGIWMYTYQTTDMPQTTTLRTFPVDPDVVPTLGLRLVAGRNFSPELASDSSAVLLNEAAVRALGLGDDPLGREVNTGQRVVGVIGDFNFQSFRETIEPIVLTLSDRRSQFAVRLGGDVGAALAEMETIWKTFVPEDPIVYNFVDDNFAQMAAQERLLGQVVGFFTAFALLIAAMGLFGLTAFAVQRRTKEIGVRKVLGASVGHLVLLLNREFVRLVLAALVVAAPFAYIAATRWLEGFAYRIDLGPGLFFAAGGLALAVAVLTVSALSFRAATIDPVRVLRYE